MGIQYLRYPVGSGSGIYLVSHQSLWIWENDKLRRICSLSSEVKDLRGSYDGSRLSFFSREESNGDIYTYTAETGKISRMTYFDDPRIGNISVSGNEVVVSSSYKSPFSDRSIYTVDCDKNVTRLPYSDAAFLAKFESKTVLQRFGYGYHMWRGYKGGLAARLYYSKNGNDDFKELPFDLNNAYHPIFVSGRLFFISDVDGIGNIFEYDLDKSSWKQRTFHKDFCVRDISSWEDRKILYSCGGRIYCYDLGENKSSGIHIEGMDYSHTDSPFTSSYVAPFATSCAVNDKCTALSFAARGHVFSCHLWDKAYLQHTSAIRHRLTSFINESDLLTIRDNGDSSVIEIYNIKDGNLLRAYSFDVGLVKEILLLDENRLIVKNSKATLFLIDMENQTTTQIVRGKHNFCGGFDCSPDKKWLVYSVIAPHDELNNRSNTPSLFLYEIESKKHYKITEEFDDYSPMFSKDGRYIYYLSNRELSLKYDSFHFNLYFPESTSICAMCVNGDVDHPFKPWVVKPEPKADKEEEKSDESFPAIRIEELVSVQSELPKGKYYHVVPVSDSKLVVIGVEQQDATSKASFNLQAADLVNNQLTVLATNIDLFATSNNRDWMIIYSSQKFRVGKSGEAFDDSDKSYRDGGWVAPSALVYVDPREEWGNILYESWWLLKEHFWKRLDKANWDDVLEKYRSLLPGIRSREDLNQIIEEMIGETATSHNYITNRGDTDTVVHTSQGYLGAEFSWKNGYEVKSIDNTVDFQGFRLSPLLEPGVNMRIGDVVIAIDGIRCKENCPIEHYLRYRGDKVVALTFVRDGIVKTVYPKALNSIKQIEYRKWVDRNRQYVHEKSGNRLGYIHIPDMDKRGFMEFHRGYDKERAKDGLVIDNRYNGGGHVSSLLISTLMRRQTGVCVFGDQFSEFPEYSNKGKFVLLCNEYSGSDGDLFPYQFRLHKLGKILGRRTWGGVVGIEPRHNFIDRGATSQPEYGIWQDDVGLSIENHGVEPDIDVQNSMHLGKPDSQLDNAIEILLKDLPNESIEQRARGKILD